jgi:DNA-3-methyladenine glycosylase II
MPPSSRTSLAAATREVAARDPDLARAIERLGPPRWRPGSVDPFGALVRAIMYQQLAGDAAGAIHARMLALFPDGLTPEGLLAVPEDQLLAAGMSRAKLAAVRDLAAKVVDGTVPLRSLRRMEDEEIVRRLSSVHGIGRWTAEMFLIFELRRMDVWPVDDLGVRRGWSRIHRLESPIIAKGLEAEGERFRPYRTAVALYCWRAAVTTLDGSGRPAVIRRTRDSQRRR